MVGTFDDVEVVFDDNYRVALTNEAVKRVHQCVDIVEMESGGRFVENEEGRGLALGGEEIGELHALVFATGERRRRLAEFDVAQTDILERLQAFDDTSFGRGIDFAEKFNSLVDGHVEHVVDIFATIFNLEYVVFETATVARLARDCDVGHELHLDGDDAVAFTLFATSAFGVKREVGGRESHLLCALLVGKQMAYLVVGFEIGGGVASRGAPDWVLIDKLNGADAI